MRLIRNLEAIPDAARGSLLALGNFDGLHHGHQEVLRAAANLAQRHNAPLGVMSFEPHPRRLFNPSLPTLRLLPLSEKLHMLRECGVDNLFLMRFNRPFAAITAPEFVEGVLVSKLAIRGLVTGDNFIFGHQRSGNADYLRAQSQKHGFDYSPLAPVMKQGAPCSSTRVREALGSGNMALAAQLLGRPYALSGRIIHGDKRGRELGFPTANLRPGSLFLPAYGVYAVTLHGETLPAPLPGVANLGIRPMYALPRPLLETYCFDTTIDLYGQQVRVELHHYLRGEQRFDSTDALIAQMKQDEAQARQWLVANPQNHA